MEDMLLCEVLTGFTLCRSVILKEICVWIHLVTERVETFRFMLAMARPAIKNLVLLISTSYSLRTICVWMFPLTSWEHLLSFTIVTDWEAISVGSIMKRYVTMCYLVLYRKICSGSNRTFRRLN